MVDYVLLQSSKTSLVEKQLQFAYDTHRYNQPFVLQPWYMCMYGTL